MTPAELIETIHTNGKEQPGQRVVPLRPATTRKLLQLQGRLEEVKEMEARAKERVQLVQALFNTTLSEALDDADVTPAPDAQFSIDFRNNSVTLEVA